MSRVPKVVVRNKGFTPFENVAKSQPIPLDKFPAPARNLVTAIASAVSSLNSNRILVLGDCLSGKSFFIEQFAYNVDSFAAKTATKKMKVFSLTDLDFPGGNPVEGFKLKYEVFKSETGLKDEQVCFITKSLDVSLLLANILPKTNVVLEMSTDTLKTVDKNRLFNVFDELVDVSDYGSLTLNQMVVLMAASIVPRINDYYDNVKFNSRTVRGLFEKFIKKYPEETLVDPKEKTGILVGYPGYWATLVSEYAKNLVFMGEKKATRVTFNSIHTEFFKTPDPDEVDDETLDFLSQIGLNPDDFQGGFLENGVLRLERKKGSQPAKEQTPKEDIVFRDMSTLGDRLKNTVLDQDEAVERVADSMLIPAAGLNDKNKPLRSMLFLGPTGVGKTQLALSLAAELAENPLNVVRVDMSEYQQEHDAAKLFGAPPGYIGSDRGGILTGAVAENPNSVILIDEIEKAHPRIFDTFLQILDAARMTDSTGVEVDFSNTIIVMTSNVGATRASKAGVGFGEVDRGGIMVEELKNTFKPEFLNRIDEIIVFNELNRDSCRKIADREVGKVVDMLREKNVTVDAEPKILDNIIEKSNISEYGARDVQRNVAREVSAPLARFIVTNPGVRNVTMHVEDGKILVKPGIEK